MSASAKGRVDISGSLFGASPVDQPQGFIQLLLTDTTLAAAPMLLQNEEQGMGFLAAPVAAVGVLRAPLNPDAILEALA